jgi:hypothetical protein
MKNIIKNITLAFALSIAIISTSNAQDITHLKEVALTEFNKIQVSLDTEVIIMKSERNHVTLVGDSTYLATLPVLVENGILEFNYAAEPKNRLSKVLIEYTNIDHATTGGTGTYYFHNIKEDRLVVFNPYANVKLTGNTNYIRVASQQGVTDVTALTTVEETMYIGVDALLVASETN